MRNLTKALLMLGLVLAFAGSASALTWAVGPGDIYAVGGLDVAIPGSEYDVLSSIADPFGGTIDFTGDVEHRIVGSSWATWSGAHTPTYPDILFSQYAQSVRLDFDCTVNAFGFYAEPNSYGIFDVTLGLSDGSTDTKAVDGFGGAAFFGFYDGAIDWLEISTADGNGFAFGEMTMACVPEPATLMLLGSGLLGLGIIRRKK